LSRSRDKAIKLINKRGVLLVFPVKGRSDPPSLWDEFYPRTPMKWEWTEDSDDRISKMWILMKELSSDSRVVYLKWYQGRATFFSRELFQALLKLISTSEEALSYPPPEARNLLDVLEEDSPLSTKQLKSLAELKGKEFSGVYGRAMNWLFSRGQIVGFGEADDGAFPSLVVGATTLIFEDLVEGSRNLSIEEAVRLVNRHMPYGSAFRKHLDKIIDIPHNFADLQDQQTPKA
jgi:hypothetical protein